MNFGCGVFGLLFIEAVHSLNLTSVDQHSELANLKQEVSNLRLVMAALNSTFNSELLRLNNALATRPLIAFTACLGSAPKVLGPHQTLEFNDVILNEGGAYDPRHGVFRAPVSGVYQFILTFLNDNYAQHVAYIEIVKEGVLLAYAFSDDGNYHTGIVQVNIKVDAGQDVWCRNAFTSSTKSYFNGNGNGKYSCFSGHIIS